MLLPLPCLPCRTSRRLRPAHRRRERAVRLQQPPKLTATGPADHLFEQRHGPPQPLRQLSRRNSTLRRRPRKHPGPTPAVSPIAPRVWPRARTVQSTAKDVGHQAASDPGSGGGGVSGDCFSVAWAAAGVRPGQCRAERCWWGWCSSTVGRRRLAAGVEDVSARKTGLPRTLLIVVRSQQGVDATSCEATERPLFAFRDGRAMQRDVSRGLRDGKHKVTG